MQVEEEFLPTGFSIGDLQCRFLSRPPFRRNGWNLVLGGSSWILLVANGSRSPRMKSNLAPTFGKESDASMGVIIQHIGAQSASRDQVPRGPTRFEPCELVQEYGRLNGEESGDVLKSETAMASHSNLGTAAFSRFWDLAKINKWPKLGNQSST